MHWCWEPDCSGSSFIFSSDPNVVKEIHTILCLTFTHARTHARTHPFNGLFSGTTRVGRYQKGETNLDFTEARDSEWQWHQLGMCKSAPRQITTPAPHHSVFFTGRMPFLPPNQQRESTEGLLCLTLMALIPAVCWSSTSGLKKFCNGSILFIKHYQWQRRPIFM